MQFQNLTKNFFQCDLVNNQKLQSILNLPTTKSCDSVTYFHMLFLTFSEK